MSVPLTDHAASWWPDPSLVPGDCDDGLPAGDPGPGLGHLARIGAEQAARRAAECENGNDDGREAWEWA